MLKEMGLNCHRRGIIKMGQDVNKSKDVYVGNKCIIIPTPAPKNIMGKCEYYRWRYNDFKSRHVHCRHDPPEYYLDYGEYYCYLFQDVLRKELSDKGKIWVDDAKLYLQESMEEGLKLNPNVELSNQKFNDFAFKTHSKAYIKAGILYIPWSDKFKIARQPDLKEWKKTETWKQAVEVGQHHIEFGLDHTKIHIETAINHIIKYFENLIK